MTPDDRWKEIQESSVEQMSADARMTQVAKAQQKMP
jgi:hypothetical protein